MKYRFPVVYTVDEKDPKFINAMFPTIVGVFTFGETIDEVRQRAKEILLFALKDEYVRNCEQKSLEEMKKILPDDIIEIIEVDYNES